MKGLTGHIFNSFLQKLIPNASLEFKMVPFSTDSLYDQVKMIADDGSEMKHVSRNGNLWFTCKGPDTSERSLEVTIPNK
jgi:hypothetical protein